MKWKLNLPESSKSVYYLLKLIGLAPFTMKNNRFHPPSVLGKLYPWLIAATYLVFVSVTFTLTVGKPKVENFSMLLKIWSRVLYLINLPSTFITPIIFSLMNKKVVYLLNKLCIVSNELKNLDIVEDQGKFWKNIFLTGVKANAALVASCVMLCLIEPDWNISLPIKYSIDSWFSFNTVLIFTQILIYIKQRFALLNERLHDILVPVGRLASPRHPRIFVMSVNDRDENQPGDEGLTDLQCIRKIEALHLELCDLLDRTTQLFAIPILLNGVRLFFQIMLLPHWMYVDLQNSNYFKIVTIFCFVCRIVFAITSLFIIAHVSTITCAQGNAMRAALWKVWIKFRPAKLQSEFIMFSIQLLHKPVVVSVFGFVILDYPFVFKILCASLTYTIVMIQFDI